MNMKEQLKDGYTVVYRDGEERTVKGDEFQLNGRAFNMLSNYDNDLIMLGYSISAADIISIRNESNVEIWKREGEEWVDLRGFETAKKLNTKQLPTRKQHNQQRITQLCKAIISNNEADIDIPEEWIDELNDLI